MTQPIENSDNQKKCLNCAAPMTGLYCQQCGQKTITDRLSFGRVLRDLPKKIFNWERGLWPTFFALWTRPGEVAADYVQGKRRPYLHPVSYFLVGSSAQLLLSLWLSAPVVRRELERGILQAKAAPGGGQNFEKLEELLGKSPETGLSDLYFVVMGQAYTYLAFFAFCCPLGLVLWLFHRTRGAKYNFAEVMVFSLYVAGHCMVVTAFSTPIFSRIGTTIQVITAQGFYLGYAVWAHRDFFPRGIGSRTLTLLSMMIASACFLASILVVFFLSLFAMVLWNRFVGA